MRRQAEKTAMESQVLVARSRILTESYAIKTHNALKAAECLATDVIYSNEGLDEATIIPEKHISNDDSRLLFLRINSLLESLNILSNRSIVISRTLNSGKTALSTDNRKVLSRQKEEITQVIKRAILSVDDLLSEISSHIHESAT